VKKTLQRYDLFGYQANKSAYFFALTFENQRIKYKSIKCRDRGLQRRKKK
jgi:hypothetical protein